MGLKSYLLGKDNQRALKKIEVIAGDVEALEDKYKRMSDEQLRENTSKLKQRLASGETLDDILPDAFANVREASWRVLKMRHFHVQLIGGIALHQGRIAEMRTGEGKTLVSTLPAYLNALTGEGVHIVTVNDYLARRDAEWMGKVHKFLGLTVGVAVSGMEPEDKRNAYKCDITYGTNNELGFDYLRDNMVVNAEDKVQRQLKFAIIDEVDSILIDEARTPLIISGRGTKSSEMYVTANRFAKTLDDEDVDVDEKKKTVHLTETGVERAERFFNVENLSDIENTELNHYINNAIRAHYIMKRDSDYIINKGEVIIVDEFTGRLMVGRRYSEGLHQAIEAKENVKIQNENKTLATITFQNYFRLYDKLSGMTGTAKTEESEFRGIYKLDVVTIPTNAPMVRIDENDQIYTTIAGKMRAIIADVEACHAKGQPVLVGTVTVDRSEELSKILKAKRIPHHVLNAKNHEREAEIVAQAGQFGSVTIATNMAGRGTDILLGGNAEFMAKNEMRLEGIEEELIEACTNYAVKSVTPEIKQAKERYKELFDKHAVTVADNRAKVVEAGGLRIIGTERHESRRIDNQLRGRAGRQGDVGSSVFYISLEDDLARLFGGDRVKNVADKLSADEDTPFSSKLITKLIENAQRNIEGANYSRRRHVLEYDNVMNKQREIIYGERNKVLMGENVHEQILNMMHAGIDEIVDDYCDPTVDWDDWDLENLNKDIERRLIPFDTNYVDENRASKWDIDEIKEQIFNGMMTYYQDKINTASSVGLDFAEVERNVLLKIVDMRWMDHIDTMDALKRGINLRAYGQQDPVIVYKKEGFELFDEMINSIRRDTVGLLMRVNIQLPPKREEAVQITGMSGGSETTAVPQPKRASKEPGRNDPCPCGSGKKYKMCCGK